VIEAPAGVLSSGSEARCLVLMQASGNPCAQTVDPSITPS
jgi:hypothetical protein